MGEPHEAPPVAEVEVGVEVADVELALDSLASPHHGKCDGVIASENHRQSLPREDLLHRVGDRSKFGMKSAGMMLASPTSARLTSTRVRSPSS
jgi:hypothetical protein